MAFGNTRITVTADTTVGTTKVASFSAIITTGTTEISINSRYHSSDLYEANKTTIEADRDSFVEYVRGIQSRLN